MQQTACNNLCDITQHLSAVQNVVFILSQSTFERDEQVDKPKGHSCTLKDCI